MSKRANAFLFILLVSILGAGAARFVTDWSPKNFTRPNISEDKYIILHTTEGGGPGSLNKLKKRGEAHFMVETDGTVYRLIDPKKLAKHAGRSLWNGQHDLDRISIGIEVVGYHDHLPTDAQINSLSVLLSQLKTKYAIADDHVLSHSMVAYGVPNRWFHFDHRGRKACGMLFATTELRRRLGLKNKQAFDPDVAAHRLIIGDSNLSQVLYGNNTSQEQMGYQKYVATNTTTQDIKTESDSSDGSGVIDGFQTVEDNHPTAYSIAGNAYARRTTIYFFPSKTVRTGFELSQTSAGLYALNHLPPGTTMLIGYIYGGAVIRGRPPSRIAHNRWNYPSTYYRFPNGQLKNGDEISQNSIPSGTLIFFQR